MRTSTSAGTVETLVTGALGGLAGGAAEIAWIGLYGAATGTPVNAVARGIVGSVIPALVTSAWATELGVLIHLGLAVALGIGLALAVPLLVRRSEASHSEFAVTILILTAVWAVNFLVVLPHVNPAFVHVLPYAVTLLSKLLFAVAATTALHARRLRPARVRGA